MQSRIETASIRVLCAFAGAVMQMQEALERLLHPTAVPISCPDPAQLLKR